jgi:hypothetical protein
MLGNFPQNPTLTSLAATLEAATAALASAQNDYVAAVMALIARRVAVRFADFASDRVVRSVQRQAENADDKKNGKIASALFPNGVTPIVRPVGQTQVNEMRSLEGRLDAAEGSWPDALTHKAKVTAEREKYEATLDERKAAMATVADLRAKRDAAKEDFLDIYAATAGRVKAEFPRDRDMQDLFFDKIASAAVDDEEEDDDEAPAPVVPPAVTPTPAMPPT